MPKGWVRGPQGQERPQAPGAQARRIMDIATGQIEERVEKPDILPPDDHSLDWMPAYGPGLPPPPRPAMARRARHVKAAKGRSTRT